MLYDFLIKPYFLTEFAVSDVVKIISDFLLSAVITFISSEPLNGLAWS